MVSNMNEKRCLLSDARKREIENLESANADDAERIKMLIRRMRKSVLFCNAVEYRNANAEVKRIENDIERRKMQIENLHKAIPDCTPMETAIMF